MATIQLTASAGNLFHMLIIIIIIITIIIVIIIIIICLIIIIVIINNINNNNKNNNKNNKQGDGLAQWLERWTGVEIQRAIVNQTDIGTVSRATLGETPERRGGAHMGHPSS